MSGVRAAILGCGGMSGAHARRFKANRDVCIVALCDVQLSQIQGLVQRRLQDYAPLPAFYTDPAQMYAEVKPDAVAIVTPHTLHYAQAVQALDAGCHVLLEKPMVTLTEDAYRLAAKVKAAGKICVVAYNTSYTPAFVRLREIIRTGALGRLELVNGYLSQNWMKLTAGTWRQDPAMSGGGQAFDSGAHLLNSLCWSVESRVTEVYAMLDNHGTRVDINACILAKFSSGVMASIAIGGNCVSNGTHACFVFENGRVEIDGWGGAWIRVFKGDEEQKDLAVEPSSYSANDNLVDAILGRAEPRVTVEHGIVQCELMDAVYESARTGRPAKPAAPA